MIERSKKIQEELDELFSKKGFCEICGGKVIIYNKMGKENDWLVTPCQNCSRTKKPRC